MLISQRAVFIGDGTLLIRCADAFRAAGHVAVAVASSDAAILEWARAQGIVAERLEGGKPRLEGLAFDYLFSVANLQVLPEDLILRATLGAFNFHDGPLPRYAGLNATSWALMAGESRHGITWHEMTSVVDRGRIARQAVFDVAPDETAFSLNARCYEAGYQGFCALVEDIGRDALTLTPQGPVEGNFARDARPEALGTLDWSRPATELCALVRGLDFGNYANPLACPKVWLGDDRVLLARSARLGVAISTAQPGTLVEIAGDTLRVATAQGELLLEGCRGLDGAPPQSLRTGQVLPPLPATVREQLAQRQPRLARAEALWRRSLSHLHAVELPYPRFTGASSQSQPLKLRLDASEQAGVTVAGFAAWLCALAGQEQVSVLYSDAALADQAAGLAAFASPWVPLTLASSPRTAVRELREQGEARLSQVRQAGPMTRDLRLRLGATPAPLPAYGLRLGGTGANAPTPLLLELHAEQPGGVLELYVDAAAFAPTVALVMARHLEAWLQAFARAEGELASVPLLPAHEAAQLAAFNDATATALQGDESVHAVIARTAAANPDQEALRCHDASLTHAQLQQRSTSLARVLRERGVRPGDIVGLCLERSCDLLVSVLAIHKAGAAYLPLDPDYPQERLRYKLADSATRLVICREPLAALLHLEPGQTVAPDARPAAENGDALPPVRGDAAAYVIYTSGSTGQPKGVVVTHANVLNFFAGMDARVPHAQGGRWLAVTSLSFDISVLELLWTLSRGITVVMHAPEPAAVQDGGPDFSLFYFSSDEGAGGGADRYRLLTEGARFADQNGFAAVWTPERHFHAFGGLYPNPMLTSAAVAAITSRVQIRAGSCVLPLHHPARLAEDWALVDNLSNGRVGVSFAAGWQPNDFVLAPQAFADRKRVMIDGIATVRRLWRGETLPFPGHDGKPVNVRTLPRPVQRELPVWLTAASNPETFQQAGELGCNVLTHLLGQTVEDVASKVAVYREARRKAGHAGKGQVTIMLHTFIGEDEEQVRETARGPMKTYLRSSVDLIRQAAWSFPTFVQRGAAAGRTPLEVMQEQPLSDSEMDALLDHAFSRYWNTSALIGTPERCLAMVQKLQDVGVDEIACLIDFGIESNTVLAHLTHLQRLMQLAQCPRRVAGPASVAQQLLRHEATHLQCTPSMATMLVADSEGRDALSRLSAMLVGGEALSLPLATQLRALVPGKLLNMYGPTETTVWSTCCDLDAIGEFVPLGGPIANTSLHIRNAWDQECPALVPGELLIGGQGVTRGYLNRPELTAQRFVEDPQQPGHRLYRTGDLVRRHPDGRLEFLGRLDHQVKIRGHRIELGEIENALASQPGVREAVVLARHDTAGEAFLVGYVTAKPGEAAPDPEQLRQGLARQLPEIMVPRLISVRASFPLTPNGKTDRKALGQLAPAPAASAAPAATTPAAPSAAPESNLEQTIAGIWCQVLGLPEVGRESNFFDLGGHSLLVIQVQRRLNEALGQEISITDMFRLPTVAAIAQHLAGGTRESAVSQGQSRAQARRALRAARGA